jgi:hypothetical protein
MSGYAAAIAVSLVSAWCLGAALADAPAGSDPNSPLAQWFKSVMHPHLGVCCTIADGRFVHARKVTGGWQVEIDQQWIDVPPEAVLNDEASPTGEPVVWIFHGAIRCFVPAGGAV